MLSTELEKNIEALIFAVPQPIGIIDLCATLELVYGVQFSTVMIEESVERLIKKYASEAFGFQLVAVAEGYQFMTKPECYQVVGTFLKLTNKKRISRAALETLAIIAYRQPTTKFEIEQIRGVNCDYAIQKLLEKELITIAGRSEGAGRPLLYATSAKFMDYFGIKSLKELPKLKDFAPAANEIGTPQAIEEIK